MTTAQALSLIRRLARRRGLRVIELPARGKGSHRIYCLTDSSGGEVVRFALTGHAKDMSWTVLGQVEDTLAPYFGERWTEKR